MRKRGLAAMGGVLGMLAVSVSPASAANDYPTVAVADYVVACMISNGQTRQVLERCSCSIDVISSIMSYDDYVKAETVARMQQMTGERSAIFRETAPSRQSLAAIRRAQAEADIRCF
ncbi:hypothetical protein GCM10011385_10540 [Nitratireductor aestuarii]|mgnify:CR=1 FL=1|uniref:Uncharacterized protein n=1 Tax=Nitratireductor aestuarii TaxID=1735103 RepID=A0A916RJI5_9HYPH|nr:hypothetical protein [Nitratireductor aestuarii]GGA58747.1 hypothetical protein GCM10011385_10540 [Nitratireductor aestuarii]